MSKVDWFLWRPCVGISEACPPLAEYHHMLDGTYTIDDVQQMHYVLDEITQELQRQRQQIGNK